MSEQHGGGAQGPRGGGGRRGAVRAWLLWWVVCAALWLALVDRVQAAELVLGAIAATIGASVAVLVRARRGTLLRPRARWLRDTWRPAVALVADVVPLVRALVFRGILRRDAPAPTLAEVQFDVPGADREDAAFRILTVILGSLGPNTIVADVDADARVLRVHQLVATADPGRAAAPLSP